MPELEPCDCSEKKRALSISAYGSKYWVICSYCGEQGDSADSKEAAIAAWNNPGEWGERNE